MSKKYVVQMKSERVFAVELPTPPNFLSVDGKTVDVGTFTASEAAYIGDAMKKQFIEHAILRAKKLRNE